VVVEMNGARILTDPLLRDRLAHLYRHGPRPDPAWLQAPDAVLLSHLHMDHCDFPSLRRLGSDIRLIVPRGSTSLMRRHGFRAVEELSPGESTAVGSVTVTATQAAHSGFRAPFGPMAAPVGYLLAGQVRIYFAGDTGLFAEMGELGTGLDVALLPIWGWGRKLGPGHLDPEQAAEALRMLHPSLAIPIHWGTFGTAGVNRRDPAFLSEPPQRFAQHAARLAPDVTVRIVPPGECTRLNDLSVR
jgi:L-ascorbate metabolism protein UlaG (beta-lactamase superfamily)